MWLVLIHAHCYLLFHCVKNTFFLKPSWLVVKRSTLELLHWATPLVYLANQGVSQTGFMFPEGTSVPFSSRLFVSPMAPYELKYMESRLWAMPPTPVMPLHLPPSLHVVSLPRGRHLICLGSCNPSSRKRGCLGTEAVWSFLWDARGTGSPTVTLDSGVILGKSPSLSEPRPPHLLHGEMVIDTCLSVREVRVHMIRYQCTICVLQNRVMCALDPKN